MNKKKLNLRKKKLNARSSKMRSIFSGLFPSLTYGWSYQPPVWSYELRLDAIIYRDCSYTLNNVSNGVSYERCNGVYYDARDPNYVGTYYGQYAFIEKDKYFLPRPLTDLPGVFLLWKPSEPNTISILRKFVSVDQVLVNVNTGINKIENIKLLTRIFILGSASHIGQLFQNYKIKYNREDDQYYHFEITQSVLQEIDFFFIMYARTFTFNSDLDTNPVESTEKPNGNYIYERRKYPDKTIYRLPATFISLTSYNTNSTRYY